MFDHGCEWVRCDFHLHTRKDKEFTYTGEDSFFIKNYISALQKQNIKIGIITNHNKFDLKEYKDLKNTALKQDIFILPGVELSVKDGKNGVHALIVFDPKDWIDSQENHIENFLISSFQGINNWKNENTFCNYDINTLLTELKKLNKDYFIIFAHIEQKSGLIAECGGSRLTSLAKNDEFKKRVLGLQKLRTNDVKNKIKNWFGYEIAYVEGSDPKNINDIGKGESCYVKLGEFSFNALKFALIDYQNRLTNQKTSISHSYIDSISFKGGKLDSEKLRLSDALNTLIGIRGSGKSSIIESIRYALNLDSNIDQEYKDKLVKNTLESGGEISLDIINEYNKHYKITRLMGEEPSIFDDNGKELNISINSIINNPIYFGQKDLSGIKSGYAFDLLNKLVGYKIKPKIEQIDSTSLELENLIRKFFRFVSTQNKKEELELKRTDLEYKLNIFSEKGLEEKLKKQISYNTDDNKLDFILKQVDTIYSKIFQIYNEIDGDQLDLSNYKSEFNDSLFANINKKLNSILQSKKKILSEIKNIETNKTSLNSYQDQLKKKMGSLKDEFALIKRGSKEESLDLDNFVTYKSDLDKLKQKIDQLTNQKDTRESIINEIDTVIKKREGILQEIFNQYKEEITKINNSQEALKIEIFFKGDKDKFQNDIKLKFKGTGISEIKIKKIAEIFHDFIDIIYDCIFKNTEKLLTVLTDNETSKVKQKVLETYDELIKVPCQNLVKIYYHNKLLEKHSIGQRASALILFVLTQEDNDLIIIDQPEDDLDNQIIYKEVIKTIKNKKKNIQLIFATHNANIPVLGDAECVISTHYDEQIKVEVGNIDCENTHQKIVNIMEGGRDAFEKRKLIYSNWKKEK